MSSCEALLETPTSASQYLTNNIDYYCYSIQDFKGEKNIKYENIPHLCDKFNIKKNLINPIYLS